MKISDPRLRPAFESYRTRIRPEVPAVARDRAAFTLASNDARERWILGEAERRLLSEPELQELHEIRRERRRTLLALGRK